MKFFICTRTYGSLFTPTCVPYFANALCCKTNTTSSLNSYACSKYTPTPTRKRMAMTKWVHGCLPFTKEETHQFNHVHIHEYKQGMSVKPSYASLTYVHSLVRNRCMKE